VFSPRYWNLGQLTQAFHCESSSNIVPLRPKTVAETKPLMTMKTKALATTSETDRKRQLPSAKEDSGTILEGTSCQFNKG
jgi:hypothetical protein